MVTKQVRIQAVFNPFPSRFLIESWGNSLRAQPGATAPDDIKDGIEQLAHMVDTGTSPGLSSGYEGLQDLPFFAGKVGGVGSAALHGEFLGSRQGGASYCY